MNLGLDRIFSGLEPDWTEDRIFLILRIRDRTGYIRSGPVRVLDRVQYPVRSNLQVHTGIVCSSSNIVYVKKKKLEPLQRWQDKY